MKISIREVAERAKVSHATVSRVLNNVDVPIAPETRRLVRHIAAEMGYHPNKAARALATGRTQTIALWSSNLKSTFYGDIIYYTHEEIGRHGYEMFVSGVRSVHGSTVDTPRLFSWPVDGILAVDMPRGTIPGLTNSLLEGRPFVHIGAYLFEGTDYVKVDFKQQAAEAVRHLADMGCKRIAYLVPDWFDWFEEVNDDRLEGYKQGMADLGREPEIIKTPNEKREDVPPTLTAYIEANGCPDGLFCYNDDMAIASYPTLLNRGMRIPEDVAIVGCNGMRDTGYTYPPLTTIMQPIEQMCATAWAFLKQRIDDPELPLQQVVLQPHLDIRGSSQR